MGGPEVVDAAPFLQRRVKERFQEEQALRRLLKHVNLRENTIQFHDIS